MNKNTTPAPKAVIPQVNNVAKPAKTIGLYDPAYIFKDSLGDFYETFIENVRIGYFIKSSNGEPSIEVRFNLQNEEMRKNIVSLELKIEKIYSKLIYTHIHKEKDFILAREFTDAYLNRIKHSLYEECWNNTGDILRTEVEKNKFFEILKNIKDLIKKAEKIIPAHHQFYNHFNNKPKGDYFSIFYYIENDDYSILPIRFALIKNENFFVIGITILPGIKKF